MIDALGAWGERWLEVTTEHTDPGFVLWSWTKYYIDPEALPRNQALVEFAFPDEPPTNRRYWLRVENQSAELCYSHSGGDPDIYVTADSAAFTQWHFGLLDWRQAIAQGSISVDGAPKLARAVPKWNRHPEPATSGQQQSVRATVELPPRRGRRPGSPCARGSSPIRLRQHVVLATGVGGRSQSGPR